MRRLVLLSAILLVLLAACGSGIEPVEVTGSTGIQMESGSAFTEEGRTYRGEWTDITDERLKGEEVAVVFCEMVSEEENSAECEGTQEVVNDGGAWEGNFTGTSIDGLHEIDGTLIGTGDYEGLQFSYHLEGVEFPWDITGTIEPVES
jgi:hypothetical protein